MTIGKKILCGIFILLFLFGGLFVVSPSFHKKIAGYIQFAQSKEELFTTPLKGSEDSKDAQLSVEGVIQYTNVQRADNNLPVLTENVFLDNAAELKLKDMFDKQYFEHVSPEGNGPGYLAEHVKYSYIVVGENLALGNFKDDEALVQAWMDSPGHRANILHTRFKEIGVAVGQGMFDGKKVWLAVQEFGAPLSDCPTISAALKTQIDKDKTRSSSLSKGIEQIKAEIETMPRQTREEQQAYNVKVDEYNTLVASYDALLGTIRSNIDTYNIQVRAYNACIKQ
jgi:uncharacterized protein YkwD